jgi:hypothetical protein
VSIRQTRQRSDRARSQYTIAFVEFVKIVAFGLVAAIVYGVIHDRPIRMASRWRGSKSLNGSGQDLSSTLSGSDK